MRLERISRVRENDILAKTILTSDGQKLLKAGVTLTENYIKKLEEIGVFYTYIEDDRLDDIELEDEKLTELKQLTMKSMKDIIRNANNSKEFKKSLRPIEELIEYIMELKDINKCLGDIGTRDNYTYMHCINTCIMSCFLGSADALKPGKLRELAIGAALHDIGKVRVPFKILNKQGKPTKEEFQEIKKHSIYGVEMLKKNLFVSDNIIRIIKEHHERIDGKGYPYGLKENQISKYARIVSICDVYDAVSNNRCYREKFSPNDAYELILSGSSTSFDEDLVIKFKNTFSVYKLASCVRLSSGEEGYVIKQNKEFPDRPIIRILYDKSTKEPIPSYEIDLLKNFNVTIDSIV